MIKKPPKLPFFDYYQEPAFRPLALAAGQVTFAWNSLYEVLGALFVTMHGRGVPAEVPLATWNAIKADRTQRDMLKAAANAYLATRSMAKIHQYARDDLKWLVDQIGNLEDVRNNIIHSPLVLSGTIDHRIAVVPAVFSGHPRAKRLEEAMIKRGLLSEFIWCRDAALILRDYAWRIYAALLGEETWPDRPPMPVHRPAPSKPHRPQTSPSKRHAPPRSSRA